MLTILCRYAASSGLPYEFVEWSLDTYGFDNDNYGNLETTASEWRDSLKAGAR